MEKNQVSFVCWIFIETVKCSCFLQIDIPEKLNYWTKLIGHYEINSYKIMKNALLLKYSKLQLFLLKELGEVLRTDRRYIKVAAVLILCI